MPEGGLKGLYIGYWRTEGSVLSVQDDTRLFKVSPNPRHRCFEGAALAIFGKALINSFAALYRCFLAGTVANKEGILTNKGSCTTRMVTLILAAALVGVFTGCTQHGQHPDVIDAVDTALTRNNLGMVKVSQDREKGTLDLTGDVESPDQKVRAENVAKQVAPGYTISNELGVRPVGTESQAAAVDSSLDSGIEDNYEAAVEGHKNLDDQSISYEAKNGTLVLKGVVKTRAQREEANNLAKAIPNVKEVVNEIEVKPDKHSSAKSPTMPTATPGP